MSVNFLIFSSGKQVVLKTGLNGEQRLVVEGLNGAALENFLQEHFAKRGRQLINQTGNAEVVIADNGLFGVEYLADLKRNLGFLKGARKILDAPTTDAIPTTALV